MFPDISGVYGLQDIRSIDAVYSHRYVSYIQNFIQPDFGTRFVGGAIGQPEGGRQADIAGNPMVNLLGARYVISGGTVPADPFVAQVFTDRVPDANVHVGTFDLGGDKRTVLFENSGREVTMPVAITDARRVVFSYGMDPGAFANLADDGVEFAIDGVTRSGSRVPLWNAQYVPRSDPVSPAWRVADVRIPPAIGPELSSLVLRVGARHNPLSDWAGWNDLQVLGPTTEIQKPLRLVGSSGGTDVYENQDRLPRAFVAHNLTYVPDMTAAVRALATTEPRFPDGAIRVTRFNPRNDAIIESSPPATGGPRSCSGGSDSARITKYASEEVSIDVNSTCAGLLVLSDMYYPGWDATVNGRAATIHPTDVLLRGVPVTAGHSVVSFRYRPESFTLGLLLALASLVGLGGATGWGRVRRPRTDGPLGAGRQ